MARRPRNAGQLDERDAGRAAVTGREPSAVGVPRWAGMPCAMRAGAESLLPGPGMSARMMIAVPGAGVSAPSAAGRSSGPAVLVCPVTIRARVWGLPSDLRAIPDPARSGASVRMGWATPKRAVGGQIKRDIQAVASLAARACDGGAQRFGGVVADRARLDAQLSAVLLNVAGPARAPLNVGQVL